MKLVIAVLIGLSLPVIGEEPSLSSISPENRQVITALIQVSRSSTGVAWEAWVESATSGVVSGLGEVGLGLVGVFAGLHRTKAVMATVGIALVLHGGLGVMVVQCQSGRRIQVLNQTLEAVTGSPAYQVLSPRLGNRRARELVRNLIFTGAFTEAVLRLGIRGDQRADLRALIRNRHQETRRRLVAIEGFANFQPNQRELLIQISLMNELLFDILCYDDPEEADRRFQQWHEGFERGIRTSFGVESLRAAERALTERER